jgi:4-nitrophenyl phosphatase
VKANLQKLDGRAALGHTPSLSSARGFVLDIDGTLALADKNLGGYQALPGAVELVSLLRQRQIPAVAFTNGTTKTPTELSKALSAIGIEFDETKTMTPISVAVDDFKRKKYKRVLVLGVEGVWRPIQEAGIEVILSPKRCDDAEAVLIGWYPKFTLADIDAACRAVWGGAALYTGSTAAYVASREGRTIGISGAISAAVHNVTGKRAMVLGKPSIQAVRCASRRLGVAPADLAIVGDDASLENAMAHRCGALSVAVHTGLGDAESFAALPFTIRPHLSLSGVDKLLALVT